MARHEIMIHENTSVTKESAPYLGSYISKETLKTDEFAAKIAEKCGLPAIQVQAIVAGAFDAIEELEKDELVRLHVDGFTVCGVITGSFPTADAKFDPEKNALQLALRVDESIRNALADVSPSVIGDASLTKLRIDNLADLEVQRPQNLIHGKHVFRVAGFCMVLTDEGAEAYLENAMGTRFELVVDEVISKQLFKAHTAELLEGGDYKLVIRSRAGDAAGPLQTATKRVKYLKVADLRRVTITEFKVQKDGDTAEALLKGENFDGVTGFNPADSSFTARMYDGDVDMGDQTFHPFGDDTWRCGGLEVGVDETVKVVLTPDPAKPDIDPTPAEATDIVE